MKLANELTVPAPIDEAWAVMLDVERVAPCLPGASIDSTEGDEYRGTMKIKLGPISSSFQGTLRIEEADEAAHRAVLSARARDSRGQGTAAATITSTMSPAEGGGTHVVVETELRVTGPAASFGRGVMQDVSAKLMGQFADCLGAEMGGKADAGAAAPGATAAEGQAAAEGSRGAALSGPLPPDVPAPPPTEATVRWPAHSEPSHVGQPQVDKRAAPPEEVLDLGALGRRAVVKRAAPVVAGALALLLIAAVLRRRSKR